jgi:hypothetical protein
MTTMLTKIENVNIHIHQPQPSQIVKAFLDALFAPAPDVPAADTAAKGSSDTLRESAPPAIGQVWPGQGGIYAGIVRGADGQPDAHMVRLAVLPTEQIDWQATLDWAKTVEADGHRDFVVPTRFQSPILYGNLRELFETSGWYWTSTEYSERYAWIQYFDGGGQGNYGKSSKARAVAVRLIPINA